MSRKRSTGWEAYRHGPSDPPAVKHRPILKAAKRQYLIDAIHDRMADWRYSPFQYEGRVRANLRASLCLKGYAWGRSDAEAAFIVSEALKGFPRPSWADGQPSATISDGYCKGCGGVLDEAEYAANVKFCCDECRRISKRRLRSPGYSTLEIITCENPLCRREFKQRDPLQRFCSVSCSTQGRAIILPIRHCANEQCNLPFQPANESALFCSAVCNNRRKTQRKAERRLEARTDLRCEHCGKRYTPKHGGKSRFCSEKHRRAAEYLRLKAAKASAHPINKLFEDAA